MLCNGCTCALQPLNLGAEGIGWDASVGSLTAYLYAESLPNTSNGVSHTSRIPRNRYYVYVVD